jgi:hypothetical protein
MHAHIQNHASVGMTIFLYIKWGNVVITTVVLRFFLILFLVFPFFAIVILSSFFFSLNLLHAFPICLLRVCFPDKYVSIIGSFIAVA